MAYLILGGSFNPVHAGHLIMAEELAAEFSCKRVVLVPARVPPHKDLIDDPGPALRVAMLRAATAGDGLFEIEDCELTRDGPSYTVDTLLHLRERYPGEEAFLAIGDDLAGGFPSWREPERIVELARLVIARRPSAKARRGGAEDGGPEDGGAEGDGVPAGFPYPYRRGHNSPIPISSSMVRERIRERGAWRRLVPEGAARIIADGRLYGYCP